MNRNFVIGGVVVAVLVIVFFAGEAINKWFNSESADRIIMVVIGVAGLVVPFVQNWSDKTAKKRESAIEAHETHKQQLVDKFEQARGLNAHNYGLLESIDMFSYKKELMQHLCLGHKDVFALIGEATIDETNRYDANQQLYKYAAEQVAIEAKALGIRYGQHGGNAFYSDAASQHLISSVVEGKNDFYSHYGDGGYQNEVYRESHTTVTQCAGYLSKEQTNQFANALNKLAKDPEIKKKYQNKEDLAARKDQSTAKALDSFRDLLNSVSSKATNLQGFCHGCIDNAGKKDKKRLTEELESFKKIVWVNERLRR
jgi:Co/Zn/Cd efflux system component